MSCVFLCVFIVDKVNFVFLCVFGFCVVNTSASDCLERLLVSEMTYYVSSRTYNSTHSLMHAVLIVHLAIDKVTMHCISVSSSCNRAFRRCFDIVGPLHILLLGW